MGKSIRDRRPRVRDVIAFSVALFALPCLVACGNCDDEIAAAAEFLAEPSHLTCTTDADCVVVTTGCHTFEGGVCGQSGINRAAAASEKWRTLDEALSDCESGSCTQCLAALEAGCTEGSCGRRL